MVTIVFLISTQKLAKLQVKRLWMLALTPTVMDRLRVMGSTIFQVTYTPRNGATAHVEVSSHGFSDETELLSNVDLTTEADAKRSIEVLDKALGEMGANQANLGALQNRMQYTINNLTQAAMNIEMARGRVMDADFAAETTVLAKHQILAQAATSMLAQANNLNSLSSACCNNQHSGLLDIIGWCFGSPPFFIV